MKNKFTVATTVAFLFLLPILSFGQTGYALFTASGAINNTGATNVTGDVGTFVGVINGFPPGVTSGQLHIADPSSSQAASDVAVTYGNLSAITCGSVLGVGLGGQTLTPGVYCTGAASTLNGELILDAQGNPNATFLIKINGALATGVGSKITLKNGASCANVTFLVNGAASLGQGSSFIGSIIGAGAINLLAGASLTGKAFTTAGAINLNTNSVAIGIPPTAPIISGPTTVCAGSTVMLSGNNNGGTWSTGATTPTIMVSAAGDYFVTNSNACGTLTSNHIIVTVKPLPIASVVVASGPITFCAGGSVVLSGNDNGGTWSTGATTPTITVTTAGDYFITNTNNCGTVTSNHIIVTVNPLPNCTITGMTPICQPATTQLCATENPPATYLWSTQQNTQCITVSATGDYSVTVTKNGCSSICTKHIDVNLTPTMPIIVASGATTFCAGGSVTLSGNNNGGTWNTGATTPTITVTVGGDYFVTNTNNCGTVNSNHISVIVNPLPDCTIKGNNAICQGQPTQLCAPQGLSSYLWSTIPPQNTSCITVNTPATYSVTVTDANGCMSICSMVIGVSTQLPTASIIAANGPTIFCAGGSVILSGNVGGVWSNGATTPTITVTTNGDYFVTNTTACGSVISNHILVTVNPLPTPPIISANGPTRFCLSGSVVLSGNNGGVWSTGETTPTITVTTAGNYFVTKTNNCGSIKSNVIVVIIDNPPVASHISSDNNSNTICQGKSILLSGNNGGIWNTGDTTTSITVTTTGDYFVTTTNACGTVTSNHIIINVLNAPIANTGGDKTICTGDSVKIGAPAIPGHTYLWSPSIGLSNATISNPTARPTTTTTYILTETITATGCQASNTVTINISVPDCSITSSGSICNGKTTTLCAPSGAKKYLWSTGDTTNCIRTTLVGNYAVTVTNALGCVSMCNKQLIPNNDTCSLVVTLTISQPITDEGSATGAITANVTKGGTAPYTYLWSNNYHEQTIEHLIAGTYTVTVFDKNCCSAIATITITQPTSCCIPIIDVGSIAGSQRICNQSELQPIVEVTPATSGTGDLIYMWMYAEVQSDGSLTDYQMVPGSGNTKNLTVFPIINTTTIIVRCVRRQCCGSFRESNKVIITPVNNVRIEGPYVVFLGASATFLSGNNSSDAQVSWFIPNSSNTIGFDNSITTQFNSAGQQTVRLTVSSQGCTRQSIKSVLVLFPYNALSVKKEIVVYPNPAKNNLYVERAGDNMLEGNLGIYNSLGQLMIYQNIHKDQSQCELDLSILPTGTYILRVTTSNGEFQIFKVSKL